jgi:ankyrin repeat protein
LSLLELQHALAIDPEENILDEDLMIEWPNIAAICAGLVVMDPITEKVNLVHYTTKMYFEKGRQVYFPGFHANITMSCATYLTMPALRNASIWTIVRRFPLAYYAAQYLGDHARQNPEDALDPNTLNLLFHLLSDANSRKPLLSLLDGLDLIRSSFYSSSPEQPVSEDSDAFSTTSTLVAPPNSDETVDAKPIIASNATNVSRDSVLEVTALHLAASMGLARVASMLLKESPNIDAVDETGKTALAVAMESGFEKAVEFLVSSGAAVNLHETQGRAALLLAAERDWRSVTDIIIKRSISMPVHDQNSFGMLLLTAVCRGSIEDAQGILEQRSSQNHTDDEILGMSLFLAVELGQQEIVIALLQGGVDVNCKDAIGQSSLHRATRRGNIPLVDVLLDYGADLESRNDDGFTPWSANIHNGKVEVLKHLIRRGTDPNTRGHNGVNVLYTSAADGLTKIVKFILGCGTNPSIRTDFAWAPIHWAAAHGRADCVVTLLEAGADVNAVSDQKMTPLDLACDYNQASMMKILEKKGAKRYDDMPQDAMATLSEATELLHLKAVETNESFYLTFDQPSHQSTHLGQFVFASQHPRGNEFLPFQLSHPLDAHEPMKIGRAHSRPRMSEYPLAPEAFLPESLVFTIVPRSADFQELEILSNKDDLSTGIVSMRRGWNGSWKVYRQIDGAEIPLFRTRPDWSQAKNEGSCWITDEGEILARTRGVYEAIITSEKTMEDDLSDTLIVCWIARVWYQTLYK